MNIEPLSLEGAYLVKSELREDERGFFARIFSRQDFVEAGLNPHIDQANVSFNRLRAVTRGLHYQVAPFAEVRLIRCLFGAIFDVIVDIRENSKTLGQWEAVELSASNHVAVYIPEGFAHGFQTLQSGSLVHYQMSAPFSPDAAGGIRWDDRELGIEWPLREREGVRISERDRKLPSWTERRR